MSQSEGAIVLNSYKPNEISGSSMDHEAHLREKAFTKKVKEKRDDRDLRKYKLDQIRLMKPSKKIKAPFENMKISCSEFLDDLTEREYCSRCGKSRKYFCYTCYIPVVSITDRVPRLKLPCKVDILKHPKEIDGKSTAVHAAVIAPEDVRIFVYPDIPDYSLDDGVLLIFPDKNALSLENLWPTLERRLSRKPSEPESKRNRYELPFTRAVFIDCTWNQTKKIRNDERVKGLQCVELKERETLFWRYQRGKPNTYLATIEAIYYFVIDVHTNVLSREYKNDYDDLLFFFKYMFEKIHSLYDTDVLLAYKDV
ncbi:DTW domain-containing protein 1 [Halocaridina rubra]|uniref:tRNA-uridine aminocarboxypropyltransferase 1 n=1 Tax=Halocaridina rubra TaxID=373956 RepID=A0AAN9A2Y3_HALRR